METLDDLLAVVPGLRRRRSLNADLLRLLLDRQDRQCTWCGGAVAKYRQTWCGDACVEAFKLRCDPNYVTAFVTKRDGGKCQRCGRDTLAAEKDAESRRLTSYLYRHRGETDAEFENRREAAIQTLRQMGYARGRWREVDHDPPVIEGGGLCGPESLRLLCGTCHDELTSALASKRAKSRKPARS